MDIDFKEIPSSRGGSVAPDMFEMFARDYLQAIGFEIVDGPDRGADGGRDLIAIEKRTGIVGVTQFKWLVSCKHYAHSNKAVGADDEVNIVDRINQFSCNGFLGFYSTIPSTGLTNRLNAINYEHQILDGGLIAKGLLENGNAYRLIRRFFPESWNKIDAANNEPSNLLKQYVPLKCDVCGQDLLLNPENGIVALCLDRNNLSLVRDAYCACRGICDAKLESYNNQFGITNWHDMSDLVIPRYYLGEVLGIADRLQNGSRLFNEDAYKKVRHIFVLLSQRVMRKHTGSEEKRMETLDMVP